MIKKMKKDEKERYDSLMDAAFSDDPVEQMSSFIDSHDGELVDETSGVSVKFKVLDHYKGDLPVYETDGAVGLDLRAAIDTDVGLGGVGAVGVIPTGLCVAVPEGYELQIRPRSGLAAKNGITVLNAPGTIDQDYRGEIMVILCNAGGRRFTITPSMRIAQMVLVPVAKIKMPIEIVDELPQSDRGEGGLGSTGTS